jgi:hypothetical protein
MGNYGINIYSNYPRTFDILRKGSFIPFIPGYRCLKTKVRSDYSIIYIEDKISSARMFDDNKTLEIKGPLKDILEASTIPFRAHFMLEQQMQKDSIFTTQGAGVSKNKRAVLLMGKRGAGKTSITLELCRKYNYKLIGNDLVLIGLKKNKGYFLEGAKIFTLRFTTVKYYNTDLQKFFKKEHPNEWTNKVRFLPKDLGISIEKKRPKIIKVFYVHLLNNESAPLYIQKIGDKETSYMGRLYLYEELSRYIRGTCIPLVYGSQFYIGDYLPSLDNPEYHKNRVKFIDWIMDKIGFYFISGSMNAICNFINQEIEKK